MQGIGFCRLKSWALAGASVAAIASPAWSQDAVRQFNIPTQDMAAALQAFGRQGDVDILFDRNALRGLTSARVEGAHAPEAALRRLLAGSGLTVRRVNGSTFIVERTGESDASPLSAALATDVDAVVITGTRIRGVSVASPVRTISERDIEQSGYGDIGELVRSFPETFAGGQNPGVVYAAGVSTNFNMSNASTINLRGLGSDATLVLLNGRRLAPDSLFQGPDISGIPLGTVQRVELLLDGSSALYGSDAVAGVANIILRRDYSGGEVSARVGTATRGGGFEQSYAATLGMSRPGRYLLSSVEWTRKNSIKAHERDFTAGATPDIDLVRPFERTSAFIGAGVELTEQTSVHFDALWSERTVNRVEHLAVQRTEGTTESPAYSASLALETRIADWDVRAVAVSAANINEDRAHRDGIHVHLRYDNSLQYFEVVADGNLIRVPTGNVRAAIGAGYREEEFQRQSDTDTTRIDAERHVSYAFAEVHIPLVTPSSSRLGLNDLDFSIAVRAEEYSDFGTTTNPRIGFRYVPWAGTTLRGTWGTSFKAPSFTQQNSPFTVNIMPASIVGQTGTLAVTAGGNRDLEPEESTSWTLGLDYSPPNTRAFTISATAFSIDFTGRVIPPLGSWPAAYGNPDYAPFITYDPVAAQVDDLVSRADRVQNFSGAPYDPTTVIAILEGRNMNATGQSASGLDLGYRQSFDIGDGSLDLFANASWLELTRQTLATLPELEISGTLSNPPDLRARGGVIWEGGGLTVSAIINHVGSGTDTGITPNARISSWTTADAQLGFRFQEDAGVFAGTRIALAVTNLFDRDPPFAPGPGLVARGIFYDGANHSAVGRFVSLQLSKSW